MHCLLTDSRVACRRTAIRSVTNLTPQQLARKRANDRESQRALRARTKQRIDGLQREINELHSQTTRDHVVQELLQENERLESELRELRKTLGLRAAGGGSRGKNIKEAIPC